MLFEELFKFLSCLDTHMLEFFALTADDNALLRVALHINHCHDVDFIVAFVEFLHNHLCGVRHFLVVGEQNFLAHDFGNEKA